MKNTTQNSTAPNLKSTVLADAFFSYECSITYSFRSGPYTHTETVVAQTPSKARYKFYLTLDAEEKYKDYFKYIKVKKIGIANKGEFHFSNSTINKFEEVKQKRGIFFAQLGMKIEVAGKMGVIVGANDHCNLNVDFGNGASNCHPKWKTTYFDNAGAILAQF